MKKLLLCTVVLFAPVCWYAQNLVPNPSFEDTVSAPAGGLMEDATGWINCGLSPDYYNAGFDSDGFGFGVPNCFYTGYQNAYNGNAFAGMAITLIPEQPGEFIGIQLTQPLIIGTKYFVSAYISRADDYPCSSNNLDFKFYNSLYFLPTFNPPPLDNFSHVNSAALVTDSLNWQLVGGSFTADSTYQYLVIGNFHDLSQTDTLNCYNLPSAYYYIDDVCVSADSMTCLIPTLNTQPPIKISEVSIYPNPTSGYLHINNPIHSEYFSLTNCMGQTIGYSRLEEGDNIIDIGSYTNGMYFLEIDKKYFFKILINNQ